MKTKQATHTPDNVGFNDHDNLEFDMSDGSQIVIKTSVALAAPDLLEAAKALKFGVVPCLVDYTSNSQDYYTCGRNNRMCPQCQAIRLLEAAIAKAESR